MNNAAHAGDGIRALREGAGLSQRELADLANVSHSHLAAFERGERNPSHRWLRDVQEALARHIAERAA